MKKSKVIKLTKIILEILVLAIVFITIGIAYAQTFITWDVGEAPQAAPGEGNVALSSGGVTQEWVESYVYANSSSGVEWAGYTSSSYTGSMGGIKGINEKCDADYDGSHACMHDEIIKLGDDYPYSQDAWIIDGSYFTGTHQATIDGSDLDSTGAATPMCMGWTSNAADDKGPYYLDGRIYLESCGHSNSIPCCY